MSHPIRGQGGHLVFQIGPKNTNSVEDVEIFCFLSSFVEFHSAVSEEKSKMSQPIRGQDGRLVFPIGPKNTNSVEDVENLLPVKFRWIPFSRFRGEVEMSQPIRGQGGHLVFPIGPKNVNLVEDIEILLPVKFHWIPFSGFREVENVSANQRPGRPSCFSDRSEKHKLGRGRWDLASWQVSLNSVQPFEKQDGRPGLWLDETFSTSPLKRLNEIQRNLTGSKISTSSTEFVFFGPIGKTRWPPWPLIGRDIFDFSEATERNSMKLDRKQDLNVLY